LAVHCDCGLAIGCCHVTVDARKAEIFRGTEVGVSGRRLKTKTQSNMPATKHQLTASLPLQIMIYYNIILSVIYFCFAGVGTYNKMNGNYQSIKPYEVSLCFLSLSSFKKV